MRERNSRRSSLRRAMRVRTGQLKQHREGELLQGTAAELSPESVSDHISRDVPGWLRQEAAAARLTRDIFGQAEGDHREPRPANPFGTGGFSANPGAHRKRNVPRLTRSGSAVHRQKVSDPPASEAICGCRQCNPAFSLQRSCALRVRWHWRSLPPCLEKYLACWR